MGLSTNFPYAGEKMKGFAWLIALGYALTLVLPLPFLPKPVPDLSLGEAVTTPTIDNAKPAATITVLDASAGVLYTFAERDFLIYTVAAEMPASYGAEALKAQAVATYTYYLREKKVNADNPDLQGAHSSQLPDSFPAGYSPEGLREKWGNDYDKHLTAVAAAVDAVAGTYLAYEDEPILAVYHAYNGGRTETAGVVWGQDFPYLQAVVSTADATRAAETTTVSDADFAAAFSDVELTGDANGWIAPDPSVTASGTVTALTVGGKVFTGGEVRKRLSLRSANFTVTRAENGFAFTAHGYGHGVGMSQVGAGGLASQGFSYSEILAHYYPGTVLKTATS